MCVLVFSASSSVCLTIGAYEPPLHTKRLCAKISRQKGNRQMEDKKWKKSIKCPEKAVVYGYTCTQSLSLATNDCIISCLLFFLVLLLCVPSLFWKHLIASPSCRQPPMRHAVQTLLPFANCSLFKWFLLHFSLHYYPPVRRRSAMTDNANEFKVFAFSRKLHFFFGLKSVAEINHSPASGSF